VQTEKKEEKKKLLKKILENCVLLSGVLVSYHISENTLRTVLEKFKTFQNLSSESKNQIISYSLSLMNACFVTFNASKHIIQRKEIENNRNLNVSMIGYFLYDFYSSYEVIQNRPTDVIHHIVGILLLMFSLNKKMIKWIPYFVLAEGSTIMLDLFMIMKEFGVEENNSFYKFASFSFAILFFILRVVNLPILSIAFLWKNPEYSKKMPKFVYVAWTIALVLQFYWFNLIWKKVNENKKIKSKL
jgi:hypothetical protein